MQGLCSTKLPPSLRCFQAWWHTFWGAMVWNGGADKAGACDTLHFSCGSCFPALQVSALTSPWFTRGSAGALHFKGYVVGYPSLQLEYFAAETGWIPLSRIVQEGPLDWVAGLPPEAEVLRFLVGFLIGFHVSIESVRFGPVDFRRLSCTFEHGLCAWTGLSNATLETDTASANSGHGFLRATSNSSEDHTSVLESIFVATEKPMALAFAFQLAGSDANTLEIQGQSTGANWTSLWLRTGSQGQGPVWQEAILEVPADTAALRFVARPAAAGDSVQLDSFLALSTVASPENASCDFEGDLCGWTMGGMEVEASSCTVALIWSVLC